MLNLARTLSSILEEEFAVLESKDLEALESIQDHKVTVLQQLDSAWSNLNAHREAAAKSRRIHDPGLPGKRLLASSTTAKKHISEMTYCAKTAGSSKKCAVCYHQESDTGQGDFYDKMGRIGKKR